VLINEIRQLLLKDVTIEWRQKYAINGILLYLVSSIFVVYLTFSLRNESIPSNTWNALFWIIILFSSVNGVAKSFIQESENRQLYYYTIANPQAILASKIVYNFFLTLILAFVGLLFYSLIMGSVIQNSGLFIVNVFFAAFGFSSTLTLVSSIASKASSSATLMAILSFPIILPILLVVVRVSNNALNGLGWSSSYDEILLLMAIDAIIAAVAFLLFPYLWRS
jgi:heme exporter protein B